MCRTVPCRGYRDRMVSAAPAAAASVLAPLLTGPRRSVRLLAGTATALYFATGEPETPLLCLCLPEAVRLPCAIVAGGPPAGSLPAARLETTAWVGDGRLELDDYVARVARWWRPHRPR